MNAFRPSFRRIAAVGLAGLALAGLGACTRTPKPIPVLMYHGLAADPGHDVWTVATDEFRRQVADLKAAGYRTILPADLEKRHRWKLGFVRKPILITFDDGLRSVLTEAELAERGGAQARVPPFADGHDGAALLQRAGFALPVSDVDRFTVRYPDLFALVRDLRAMGETNVLNGPIRPLTRSMVARAADLYAQRHGDADGRIPATFEIIHVAGWKPHESQQKPLPRGSAKMRLADALGVKERTGEEAD